MIRVRRAETDADLEAWRRVRYLVLPNESAWTVEQFRKRARPTRLVLVAELDGEIVGSGLGDRSDLSGLASVVPRVIPAARRRGVGTELLRELAAHAASLGVAETAAFVDDPGSLAFATRFGFREVDRQVEQVRAVANESAPPPLPDGVADVSIADRPELLREAYELAVEGYSDMATIRPVSVSLDDWLADEATLPEGSFVALAGEEIVGYAGLCRHDGPGTAENGLTVVRRAWRGRGLGTALKRRQLAWAAANGVAEIVTWTQRGNENMRRVNERLGFVVRSESVTMTAPLPLPI